MECFCEALGSVGRIQRTGQRERLSQLFGREERGGGAQASGGGVEAALHRGGGAGQEAGGPCLPQGAGQVPCARRRGDFFRSFSGLFSCVCILGASSDSIAGQSWLETCTSPGAGLACRGKGPCV